MAISAHDAAESSDAAHSTPPESRLLAEAEWLQRARAGPAFEQLKSLLVDCCRRLGCQHKCADPQLSAEPRPKPSTERFQLQPRGGSASQQDSSLTASICLCGDSVVQAEVSLKYAKSASGFYRATAQPDVHWKMQQLQDAANATVRALDTLSRGQRRYTEAQQRGGDQSAMLAALFQAVKADLKPKKKSLVELCNFHPIKSFVPPLPHDILLSFYLSSAKLVCAAYQVAQKEGAQTVTVYQAECQVPRLVELVQLLNEAFAVAHDFWANLTLLTSRNGWLLFGGEAPVEEGDLQLAEHWTLGRDALQAGLVPGPPQPKQQLDRPRFAATELGVRQRLLVLLLARSPPVAPALFSALSATLPTRPLVPQTAQLAELLPADAQPLNFRPGPVSILSTLANVSLHNSADWFFLLPDSTFVDGFRLQRLLNSIHWGEPLALGWAAPKGEARCLLEAGILLSAPAMQALVQNRHLCHGFAQGNGISEDFALETCLRLATNLSCSEDDDLTAEHRWWRVSTDEASDASSMTTGSIHSQIERLSRMPKFNHSLTISPLLSERDVHALEEHFLHVELARTEREIDELEAEIVEKFDEEETGWPVGVPEASKGPNRFQVPIWELVDAEWRRFGNDPEQNYAQLSDEEKAEWEEVLSEAIKVVKSQCVEASFRQGYKRFSPGRGMDYLLDLDCQNDAEPVRVELVRPMESTKLLEKVPYVREDGEVAILVPVESAAQVHALRPLLRRILAICLLGPSSANEAKRIRVLIAARGLDAIQARLVAKDLSEMKRRCRSLSTTLLLLHPDPEGRTSLQLAALDEAVDRFGTQLLFLLMSPFSDFQADFLDRVRLHAIQHFQVFFPIPFAEFSQFATGPIQRGAEFLVHKDRGRFDPSDWQTAALFGADFTWARARNPSASSLSALFQSQNQLHLLRAIDPSLRLRPHPRICSKVGVQPEAWNRCERNRRLTLGTRAQLARLLVSTGENVQGLP